MKRTLSLTLSCLMTFVGFVSLAVSPALGQEQIASLSKLREQISVLEKVENDPATPPDVKEMNRSFLEARRAQLRQKLDARLNALKGYKTSTGSALTARELETVDNSIRGLEEDLTKLANDARLASTAPVNVAVAPTIAKTSYVAASTEAVNRKRDAAPDPQSGLDISTIRNNGDSAVIKIAIPQEVENIKIVVKDSSSKVVFSREYKHLNRSLKAIEEQVSLASGDNTIEVTGQSEDGQTFPSNILSVTGSALPVLPNLRQTLPIPEYQTTKCQHLFAGTELERRLKCPESGLTGILVGGVVVSQQEKNFSQSDPFMGFVAGYDSRVKEWLRGGIIHFRVQGIFQVQAQKAAAMPTASPAASATPTPTPSPMASPTPPSLESIPFLASRKTFDIDAHMWIDWALGHGQVRVGPYFGIGASTFLDPNELKNDQTVSQNGSGRMLDSSTAQASNDLKRFIDGGVIANFLRTDGQLFMQTQFLYGNYESLRDLVKGHDTKNRFVGRLRIFPTGLQVARVPATEEATTPPLDFSPFFGVELNAGRGPDQLKFFTGVAISISRFRNLFSMGNSSK